MFLMFNTKLTQNDCVTSTVKYIIKLIFNFLNFNFLLLFIEILTFKRAIKVKLP